MTAAMLVFVGGAVVIALMYAKYKRGWDRDRADNEHLSRRVDAMCGEIDRKYPPKC